MTKVKSILLMVFTACMLNSYAGVSAKIVVKKFNGEFIKDTELSIIKFDFQSPPSQTFKVITDEKGEIHLKDKLDPECKDYYLLVQSGNFNRLSTIGKKDGDTIEATITVGPHKGDMAPDFEMYDVNTGKTVKLSDFKGKVVYLDFWATTCGPCQEPMSKNNEWMKKNKDKWKDKALIIGISHGDKDVETVKKHVDKKGWTAFPQYWIKDPKNGAHTKYEIRALPTAIMIDKNGKITYRGHPVKHDAEEEINRLIEE